MTPESRQPEDWQACPSGELQGLRQNLNLQHTRRQQAKATRMIGGSACVLLLVGMVWSNLPGGVPAEISCLECGKRFAQYHEHLTGQALADPAWVAQTEAHFEHCEMCRGKFDAKHPGVAPWSLAAATALLWLCLGSPRNDWRDA